MYQFADTYLGNASQVDLWMPHELLPVPHCPWEKVFLPLLTQEHRVVRILFVKSLS